MLIRQCDRTRFPFEIFLKKHDLINHFFFCVVFLAFFCLNWTVFRRCVTGAREEDPTYPQHQKSQFQHLSCVSSFALLSLLLPRAVDVIFCVNNCVCECVLVCRPCSSSASDGSCTSISVNLFLLSENLHSTSALTKLAPIDEIVSIVSQLRLLSAGILQWSDFDWSHFDGFCWRCFDFDGAENYWGR